MEFLREIINMKNIWICKGENISEFTKFRMSTHWLPIERGRFEKLIVPREERLCYFCKSEVGTESKSIYIPYCP